MSEEKKKLDLKSMDWKKLIKIIPFLKHLIKDPINNPKELEERKEELIQLLIVCIALIVVFGLLALIPMIGSIFFALAMVPMIGLILCAVLFFVFKKIKERFKMLTCNNCGELASIETSEDFEKYVSYSIALVGPCEITVGNDQSKDGKVRCYAKAYAIASYIIDLTCPNCNEKKKLTYATKVFECAISQNSSVFEVETVKINLEKKVKEVVAMYESAEDNKKIPVTIHSKFHPDHANRTKIQLTSNYPHINGVTIKFNRLPIEMVEAYFVGKELNGTISEVKKK